MSCFDECLPVGNLSTQILAVFYLNELDRFIKEKLEKKYLLELHPKKAKIFSFNQGFTFLGYRFLIKNNRLILLMASKNIKIVKKKNAEKYSKTMDSHYGYFLNCKCQSFLKKHDFL